MFVGTTLLLPLILLFVAFLPHVRWGPAGVVLGFTAFWVSQVSYWSSQALLRFRAAVGLSVPPGAAWLVIAGLPLLIAVISWLLWRSGRRSAIPSFGAAVAMYWAGISFYLFSPVGSLGIPFGLVAALLVVSPVFLSMGLSIHALSPEFSRR